jgi:hypothetical protein
MSLPLRMPFPFPLRMPFPFPLRTPFPFPLRTPFPFPLRMPFPFPLRMPFPFPLRLHFRSGPLSFFASRKANVLHVRPFRPVDRRLSTVDVLRSSARCRSRSRSLRQPPDAAGLLEPP